LLRQCRLRVFDAGDITNIKETWHVENPHFDKVTGLTANSLCFITAGFDETLTKSEIKIWIHSTRECIELPTEYAIISHLVSTDKHFVFVRNGRLEIYEIGETKQKLPGKLGFESKFTFKHLSAVELEGSVTTAVLTGTSFLFSTKEVPLLKMDILNHQCHPITSPSNF
jgi:hypothetical protein